MIEYERSKSPVIYRHLLKPVLCEKKAANSVRCYCKTHYYRAPFNFTHFALGDDNAYITGADIRSKQQNNGPSSGDPVDARN